MWEEIVKEGEVASEKLTESVRLLHVPDRPTSNEVDPTPPPGYWRRTYDSRGGTYIFAKAK